ncbi:hypothetical protein FXB41_34575 [Bradyrhizobium canariense]|uniref:hypothetical protein n=1 Tax=Bradyrhizobium canariense TaxID=255045 RepID=UPI001CA550F9|nr:hypothetical protein [Bradyrhizobium canariense]MBW5439696.1 hypothetical protein [Bradyrhizobium canariense]
MRSTLLHARVRLALHNTPKERPDGFPVQFVGTDGRLWKQKVAPAEFPILWMLPVLERPGILRGVDPGATSLGILRPKVDNALREELRTRPGVRSVTTESGGVMIDIFYRWIAKIAFCYGVAKYGYGLVGKSALKSLVKKWDPHANHLIGGKNGLILPSQQHHLEPEEPLIFRVRAFEDLTDPGKRVLAVELRLLPLLETPTYIAILTELQDGSPTIPPDPGYELTAPKS